MADFPSQQEAFAFGRERRYEQTIRYMRPRHQGGRGYSPARARREAGITPTAFEQVNYYRQEAIYSERGPRGGKRPRWRLRTEEEMRVHLPAPVFEYNADGSPKVPPQVGWGERYGTIVGTLWNALGYADMRILGDLAGRSVEDAAGRRYVIPTVDTMTAWWNGTTDEFQEEFWRLFESDPSRRRMSMSAGGKRAA